jgi:hypothetical protein
MGGRRGPIPKHPDSLVTVGDPPLGTRPKKYDPDARIAPRRLPTPAPAGGWHVRARSLWRTLTAHPTAAFLDDADWERATEMLWLTHRMYVALDDPTSSAASITGLSAQAHRIAELAGLTEIARRRRYWFPSLEQAPSRGLAAVTSISGGLSWDDLSAYAAEDHG